jgi:hypothetical protein
MRRAFRLVPGTGYPVSGTWHLGPDTWYRIDTEGRIPNAEDRRPSLATGEPAHRVCFLRPAPPILKIPSLLEEPYVPTARLL